MITAANNQEFLDQLTALTLKCGLALECVEGLWLREIESGRYERGPGGIEFIDTSKRLNKMHALRLERVDAGYEIRCNRAWIRQYEDQIKRPVYSYWPGDKGKPGHGTPDAIRKSIGELHLENRILRKSIRESKAQSMVIKAELRRDKVIA